MVHKYIKYIEYTGYGNPKIDNFTPCEEYVYNDIDRVYEHLTETLKIDPKSIILYGRSLGSGPSCYLAEKQPVGG
jgi:hypothetical protein